MWASLNRSPLTNTNRMESRRTTAGFTNPKRLNTKAKTGQPKAQKLLPTTHAVRFAKIRKKTSTLTTRPSLRFSETKMAHSKWWRARKTRIEKRKWYYMIYLCCLHWISIIDASRYPWCYLVSSAANEGTWGGEKGIGEKERANGVESQNWKSKVSW